MKKLLLGLLLTLSTLTFSQTKCKVFITPNIAIALSFHELEMKYEGKINEFLKTLGDVKIVDIKLYQSSNDVLYIYVFYDDKVVNKKIG